MRLQMRVSLAEAGQVRRSLPARHPSTIRVRCTYTPQGFEFETADLPGSSSDTALDFAFDTESEVAQALMFMPEMDAREGNLWQSALETSRETYKFSTE